MNCSLGDTTLGAENVLRAIEGVSLDALKEEGGLEESEGDTGWGILFAHEEEDGEKLGEPVVSPE